MRGNNFIKGKKPTKIRNNLCGFLGIKNIHLPSFVLEIHSFAMDIL
jgi:hypothetical protein